jgi:hypothetical protein
LKAIMGLWDQSAEAVPVTAGEKRSPELPIGFLVSSGPPEAGCCLGLP